ncbi:MAG TPA: tetratricopeptide repeat protein [Chitinophagaceae bacterium]|jgi:tetratricopeptide (TPR) repeat protein|nr:tetratricopeptide repeat protein [Chitinophagaceae bacterium]
MKYIFFLIVLVSAHANAQNTLQFNKRFVESEDRWVAFQPEKDSSYTYGFIYIDAQAGLTFNREGKFTISSAGVFVPIKLEDVNIKARLEPNNVLVAFIPENKFQELKITAIPGWLEVYKHDTASVGRLFRWGFLYNGYGECAKGLGYLERVQKIDPKFKGLEVELAFSYNCLGQHDKAITILESALQTNPADAYCHKELIYAELQSGQLDKAAASCKKAIKVCTDTQYHGESCYNLLYSFYKKKDKTNFTAWLPEAKKWNAGNRQLAASIQKMEEEMTK